QRFPGRSSTPSPAGVHSCSGRSATIPWPRPPDAHGSAWQTDESFEQTYRQIGDAPCTSYSNRVGKTQTLHETRYTQVPRFAASLGRARTGSLIGSGSRSPEARGESSKVPGAGFEPATSRL